MNKETAKQLILTLLSSANIIDEGDIIEFCDYSSQGWWADGTFGFYDNSVTYYIYWESNQGEMGPFKGEHNYIDEQDLIKWFNSLMFTEFEEAR